MANDLNLDGAEGGPLIHKDGHEAGDGALVAVGVPGPGQRARIFCAIVRARHDAPTIYETRRAGTLVGPLPGERSGWLRYMRSSKTSAIALEIGSPGARSSQKNSPTGFTSRKT